MQKAISLTGRTGSTCSRERYATEDASPSWMSFITRFSYGEIAFEGIVSLKTCWKIEIETERQWVTCSWSEKKNQRMAPGGKIGTQYPILCHVMYVLSEKNVHAFRLAMSVIDGEKVMYVLSPLLRRLCTVLLCSTSRTRWEFRDPCFILDQTEAEERKKECSLPICPPSLRKIRDCSFFLFLSFLFFFFFFGDQVAIGGRQREKLVANGD